MKGILPIVKILIVKTSALGDILHTFPVLSWIKSAFPHARLHWAVEEAGRGLLEAHSLVEKVITIDTKRWRKRIFYKETWKEMKRAIRKLQEERYDVLFDLQGNIKSSIVTYFSNAKVKVGFGKRAVPEGVNLLFTDEKVDPPEGNNIRDDHLHVVKSYFGKEASPEMAFTFAVGNEDEALLKECAFQDSILVCPFSAWYNKRLSHETLKDFLRRIEEKWQLPFLFLWGNEEEKDEAQNLAKAFPKGRIVDKLPLPVLQNMMENVKCVITMDSLPLHLCATTATPSFSIFGPSLAVKYKPIGDRHGCLQGPCPYSRVFEKRCPILRTCSTGACLHDLTGEQLYESFMAWWRTLS